MDKKNIIYYTIILVIIFKMFNKSENFIETEIKEIILDNSNFNVEAFRNLSKISNDILNDNKLTIYGGINVEERFNYLPKGIIVAWNSQTIPKGWARCDGKNGTPNLVNKMILGNSSSHKLNTTGGSTTVTLNQNQLPSHTHSVSISNVASHSHSITGTDKKAMNSSTYSRGDFCTTKSYYCSFAGTHNWCSCYDKSPAHRFTSVGFQALSGLSLSSSGSHYHNVTFGGKGGSAPHNNMPPYYVLIWIMKL